MLKTYAFAATANRNGGVTDDEQAAYASALSEVKTAWPLPGFPTDMCTQVGPDIVRRTDGAA